MSNYTLMHFTDEAIILSTRKFSERDLICQFFTKTRGVYGGLIKAGQSRKKMPDYQIGNVMHISWKARLDEHLGVVTAETVNTIGANLLHDIKRLMAVLSASVLIRKTLAERDPHQNLYAEFLSFLQNDDWQKAYLKFELALLRELGFGLDLEKCAVTGRQDNLVYISPASGRAVTAEGAAGYEDKLFNMPCFNSQIPDSLKITEYFLMRNVFSPHNWQLPQERAQLRKIMG